MPGILVAGAQFGDEGKGKVTDLLAEECHAVVRFQGGNNAGHTVVVNGEKYKFHLIPSGAVRGKRIMLGAGVVVDPRVLAHELSELEKKGIRVDMVIDSRAHVIMPYHNLIDGAREATLGAGKIGTTGRGIGPCYEDAAARIGVRVQDLVDEEELKKKLSVLVPLKKEIIEKIYGVPAGFIEQEIFNEYSALGKKLERYVSDVSLISNQMLSEGKTVLFEGAQGAMLDYFFGTYPFVTSSHPTAGGACVGAGVAPKHLQRVVGVMKAYTTRVGSGPFPTELHDATGNEIRERGAEYGTTTGRPRRIGWLDLVVVRLAHRLSGFTEIALTKLDVLSGIKKLRIATSYDCVGRELKEMPADPKLLEKCVPDYVELDGFAVEQKDFAKAVEEGFGVLPEGVKKYVETIEELLEIPVSMVSFGAGRDETLFLK